jgi:hypothetical protein
MKNSNLEFVKALILEMNQSYEKSGLKNPDKADRNKDKKISSWEKKVGAAIEKNVKNESHPRNEAVSGKLEVTVYNRAAKKIVSKTLVGANEDVSIVEVPSGNIVYNSEGMMESAGMTEGHEGQDQEVSEGLGNDIGDKVYFKPDKNFGKKFPPSQGYYAIIQDVTPASNYNMNALYKVVVHDKDDKEIGTIRADWTNFSTKPINENHEGQDHEVSMANNSLDSILWAVGELKKHLGDQERDIPAWIQDHITNAENFITQAAKNFHDYGGEEPSDDMSLAAMSPEELNEMIKKVGSKYNVYSKKGKKLGSHPSKKKAQKQMAAIEISKQGK